MTTAFDFSARLLSGEEVSLSRWQGRVLLIVNTASQCGFTPQYAGLEALHEKLEAEGLTVLGFPCDQFGGQEPGDAAAIGVFCERNYGVRFPVFAKVEVKGANAHPLFQWLTAQKRGIFGTKAIKWNFTKFLVGRDGAVRARYASRVRPEKLEAPIRKLLTRVPDRR